MMKNITKEIDKAKKQDVLWSIDHFYSFINNLENIGMQVSFWDGEENWASVVVDEKIIAYVWHRYPLIFIISDYFDNIYQISENLDFITILKVEDFKEKKLSISPEECDEIINSEINLQCFSVEDFWFYTNSI